MFGLQDRGQSGARYIHMYTYIYICIVGPSIETSIIHQCGSEDLEICSYQ